MRNKNIIYFFLCVTICITFSCNSNNNSKSSDKTGGSSELRVLAWVGYDERDLIDPFEKEFGVKVKTETFTGADIMFAKITQNPDAYDVVVIDPEYIEKLDKAGILSELKPEDYAFNDYLEPLKKFKLCYRDGKLLTVLIRYGVNALVYNTEKLTKAEVSSYQVLWSPKLKGKVGMWDWYLPSMGVISASQKLNTGNPYELNESQVGQLESSLKKLQPNVKAFLGSFSDINGALARGDVWAVPAVGDHTASILAESGHPIDWVIPKEGGIMWIETLGIPKLAKNKETAVKYIQYMQRPETQAKLAWRKAYRSNIPNIKGIDLLTTQQKDYLKVHSKEEGEALVKSIYIRLLPTDENGKLNEKRWQEIWQKFKQGSL